VEQHGKWILEKTSNIADAREIPKKREYQDKGKFLYLGKEYFLHELIETNGLNEENLKKNLKKFYFSSCEKIVRERIHIYQIQLRVKPKTIEVVESKTKWGKL
jgi:predicted metal-dependent hydrolase